jgi:hypothetical protein
MTNATLVLVGSNFSKTSQIWDAKANKALTTIYSGPTQVCSTGYTFGGVAGNYPFYVKDSVSGLKSASLTIVVHI